LGLITKLDTFHTHDILSGYNGFDYLGPKLIFSSKEKELVTTKEILTTGSSPRPPMKTIVFSNKYSDTIVRYGTCCACG